MCALICACVCARQLVACVGESLGFPFSEFQPLRFKLG